MSTVVHITEQLEKPEVDDRSYRVIKLPNQMEVLLIHDPNTDKDGAALNIKVGNFSDPDNMPGMAHALEVSLPH
jgi:insulysin